MTRSIFFGHDFFGAGNFGDDLMLEGFVRCAASAGVRTTIVAGTPHDIASQRRRFPTIRWFVDDPEVRDEQLRACDVWLGLGDTPFQNESGPWSLDHLDRERERCQRFGKPMVFLGVGCDSPEAVRDLRGRRVAETATRIWTRDARSAEALGDVAASGVVELGSDLAHITLGTGRRPAPERALLGILLGLQRAGIVDLEALEQSLERRRRGSTRWLVQEARSFPCTERWNYANLSERTRGALQLMPLDYSTDRSIDFLAYFGAPETVVSSRYHGALVAAWHGCRVSVIKRSDKLDGIVSDFEVPAVSRITSAAEFDALAQRAVPVDRARLETLRQRAATMCDAFFAWLGET